jgi:hypothetical protein
VVSPVLAIFVWNRCLSQSSNAGQGSSILSLSTLGTRPQPRRKIFQVGELRVRNSTLRVHLLDVSEGGVRLHCTSALDVGSPVMLCWQEQCWRGVIVWAADGRCGVRFNLPLSADTIAAITAPY